MRSLFIATAAIVLAAIPGTALPAEKDNAKQVLSILKIMDIEHPYLTDTAYYIDEHTEGGYFYLANEEIVGGLQIQLRYDTDSLHTENLQLNITEPGANYNITGSVEGVMFRYKLEF